jgi:hypothetical protein
MSTYPNTIIFCIDVMANDVYLTEYLARFAVKAKGRYNFGPEETSYIIAADKFWSYIYRSGAVSDQESVLSVTGCNKMYASLVYLDKPDGVVSRDALEKRRATLKTLDLGSMQQVSEAVARSYPSWTHNLHNDAWYITALRNPDHSKEILPYGQKTSASAYADDMDLKHGDRITCVSSIGCADLTVGRQYTVFKDKPSSIARVVTDDGVARITSGRFVWSEVLA